MPTCAFNRRVERENGMAIEERPREITVDKEERPLILFAELRPLLTMPNKVDVSWPLIKGTRDAL
jgi:hypothetical protein